jgi:hypothetical protein
MRSKAATLRSSVLSVIPHELDTSSGRPLLVIPGPDLSMAMMSLAHTWFQPLVTPHGFLFQTVRAVASRESSRAEIRAMHMGTKCLYCPDRPSLYFCASLRWPAVGVKLDAWKLGATSATAASMLASTGVARKAWVSPACGPLSTVPIPAI